MDDTKSQTTLRRAIGFWPLVLFGVGDMLGSGIYALIGKVAGLVGDYVWLAFLASMVVAALTALSYAVLGSRYPKAGGAAFITHRAFGRPFLAYVVGLAVVASGLTSMAVQTNAFANYFAGFVSGLPRGWVMLIFVASLTAINMAGIRESTRFNIACTLIEVGGLLIIIVAGLHGRGPSGPPPLLTDTSALTLSLVVQAAILAFYSFIGFEDMINVSEEVKEPQRIFPPALMTALMIATLLYVGVSFAAVSLVPPQVLAESKQPLVDVVQAGWPAFPSRVLSGIALFAITNTALINFIMGSRLVYGMAHHGLLPGLLGRLHPGRRTPHVAIGILAVIALALAFSSGIADLAASTTLLLLGVFLLVNVAAIVLQRGPDFQGHAWRLPAAAPAIGAILCAALLLVRVFGPGGTWRPVVLATGVLVVAALLYRWLRPPVSAVAAMESDVEDVV